MILQYVLFHTILQDVLMCLCLMYVLSSATTKPNVHSMAVKLIELKPVLFWLMSVCYLEKSWFQKLISCRYRSSYYFQIVSLKSVLLDNTRQSDVTLLVHGKVLNQSLCYRLVLKICVGDHSQLSPPCILAQHLYIWLSSCCFCVC